MNSCIKSPPLGDAGLPVYIVRLLPLLGGGGGGGGGGGTRTSCVVVTLWAEEEITRDGGVCLHKTKHLN